jgi:hypothetical protein
MAGVATFSFNTFDGERLIPSRAIPAGISAVGISFDGTTMLDPNLRLAVALDFSFDGVTWASTNPGRATDPFPINATYSGGAKDRDGSPVPEYNLEVPFPPGPTRFVKGSISVTGAKLTTTATLTAR